MAAALFGTALIVVSFRVPAPDSYVAWLAGMWFIGLSLVIGAIETKP
jgi:hypothetical protein